MSTINPLYIPDIIFNEDCLLYVLFMLSINYLFTHFISNIIYTLLDENDILITYFNLYNIHYNMDTHTLTLYVKMVLCYKNLLRKTIYILQRFSDNHI